MNMGNDGIQIKPAVHYHEIYFDWTICKHQHFEEIFKQLHDSNIKNTNTRNHHLTLGLTVLKMEVQLRLKVNNLSSNITETMHVDSNR